MNEELEKLLGAELAKQVKDKLGDKKLIFDDGTLVPKKDYVLRSVMGEEVAKAKKTLETQLAERDEAIAGMKKDLAKNAEAVAKISEVENTLKEKDKTHSAEVLKIRKEFAGKEFLMKEGAPAELAVHLDYNKIVPGEGDSFVGIKEQIESMKTGPFKALFGQKSLNGQPPKEGDVNTPSHEKVAIAQKAFDDAQKQYGKMSVQAFEAQEALFKAQQSTKSN